MNFYGAKDLAASFRTVRKNTIVIAEEIPEEKYGWSATPDTRPVAQTLVHIALGTRFHEVIFGAEKRTNLDGFDYLGFIKPLIADEQTPRTKAQIITLLTERGDAFASWLEGLSDDFLSARVTFPVGATPPSKTRFEIIMGAKEHEMHHRGQLMLIERLVGVVPHLTREQLARREAMSQQAAGKASA